MAGIFDDAESDRVEVNALDVLSVVVSPDGRSLSSITFSLDIGDTIEIAFTPELLAKLEAMLAQAAIEQAKQQPRQ
ncbi:MAG TPA: hypothetical protein VGV17_15905 [Bosea sp. (in: a-proteobacteria)]|uniref:hypothetical protein n=1 Tax=Bosea sp. (in: a-proteobacteria) TaxID=1871050 RepID=UPI002DDD69E6|nr:hypothetical protein [Bosea sp. (in: a-proteobacteria)]HEV2555239.1 hypothetical protein [Bosea sp. (in: a-proteobacteria)]